MATNSAIEWLRYPRRADGSLRPGHTFNPWRGCTRVSSACDHCYAETMSKRNPAVLGEWGPEGTRAIAVEAYWANPVRWNAEAQAAGERHRVFCASLADVFEGPETMPPDAWGPVKAARAQLFDLIDRTPWLDWILLTKRPENIRAMWPGGYRPNVWRLATVEDQTTADQRIPELIATNDLSPIAGLSMEPLRGEVDLSRWLICRTCNGEGEIAKHTAVGRKTSIWGKTPCPSCGGAVWRRDLHWIIAGGESGPQARPSHPRWFRLIRDQARDAGVPFFFKQWGEWIGKREIAELNDYGWQITPAWRDAVRDRTHWGCLSIGGEYLEGTTTWNGRQESPDHLYETTVYRVGKTAAGRLLDGQEYSGVPEPDRRPA